MLHCSQYARLEVFPGKVSDARHFLEFTCTACGLKYYLHKAVVADVDDGLCVSCSREVAWLEAHVGEII